ncbi:MAG: hypothetical protein AB7F22_10665 [Reyranella sp.]|uniref:hypothetical protein n=1 Tax=Reyranella sp. TaxID=1929291 RepID=UPI003D0D1F5B
MPDPITGLASTVGLFLFNAGVPLAVVNAATTITLFGAGLGLAAGISSAANTLSQSLNARQGLGESQRATQGLRFPVRQAIPDQRLVLGRATSSGAWFFSRSKPPYIWIGYLIAAHECGDLEEVVLNAEAVRLNSSGLSIAAPYFDGTTNFLKVSYRAGTADQAIDPIIAADFPSMPADFRQRGHATVVIKAHYGADDDEHRAIYGSGGAFNPLFRFKGAKVYDPRKGAHVLADPTTWTWSDNASLCLARWLIHPWPNMRLVRPDQIDWDKIAAAADIDDLWRGRKDGTAERNHTVNGIVTSSEDPLTVTRSLLSTLDGLLILDGGKYHTIPGNPREPVMTLHQDMLASGLDFQAEASDRDLINTIKTEMVAPDREYQTVVGPVLADAELVAADGQTLETTTSLRFVEGHQRAQRLGNRIMQRSRDGRSLAAAWTTEANRAPAGSVVRVYLRDFPQVNGLYQVRQAVPDHQTGTVSLQLTGWSNAVFDWNAATQERDFEIDQDVLDAEAA